MTERAIDGRGSPGLATSPIPCSCRQISDSGASMNSQAGLGTTLTGGRDLCPSRSQPRGTAVFPAYHGADRIPCIQQFGEYDAAGFPGRACHEDSWPDHAPSTWDETHCCAPERSNAFSGIKGPTGTYT